ncbi:MAG: selenocysteine-specific translation elongation factor, partial [Planctomycetes bacterium UTPLA1]
MIVGTAGHIDHGKTTLIRVLTGVDTDRLPEEKKRGLSIELGYAYLDVGDSQRIGFVDVPGHERFVRTMLAGAAGIDFVLLVIAVDDGVMPQTLEHVAILTSLGITRGAVVLTKTDLVGSERIEEVREQVLALLLGTQLASFPVLPVSALRGDGLDALKALLLREHAHGGDDGRREEWFRLAIDRSFVLDGVG